VRTYAETAFLSSAEKQSRRVCCALRSVLRLYELLITLNDTKAYIALHALGVLLLLAM